MIRRAEYDLGFYLDRVRKGEPFSFSRWGDGEWGSLLQRWPRGKKNCDGHAYYPEMGEELADVLRAHPSYFVGVQPLAVQMYGQEITGFLEKNGLSDLAWHDAEVFHKASMEGSLPELFGALREATVLLVGPRHLRKLRSTIASEGFVRVPKRNCYKSLDRIERNVRDAWRELPKPLVIAICAGMPANLLIDRLHADLSRDAFLIDFGSVFDPYVGVRSRSYMRELEV